MKNKQSKTIYICDDHILFAESLKAYLALYECYEVIGYSDNISQAYDDILKYRPNIILIDYQLKKSNGLELLKKLIQFNIKSYCFILTMKNDPEIKSEAKMLGAAGYLLKDMSGDDIIAIFENLEKNNINFYEHVESYNNSSQSKTSSILTKRELEIARFVCQGYSSSEIAKELHLSVLTVSTHRKHILKKLDAKNSIELLYKLRLIFS